MNASRKTEITFVNLVSRNRFPYIPVSFESSTSTNNTVDKTKKKKTDPLPIAAFDERPLCLLLLSLVS